MRAVDTNILIRLITRDDAGQADAADSFIEAGAWVSIVALAETIWVLSSVYDRTTDELLAAIEGLLNHRNLTLQDSDAVAAALDLFRARPSLGFSDCLIIELARKAGHLRLGTFDRGLARVPGAQRL